ncbi:hypothetical protein [Oscillatoria sp. FACHB-1407]|nr:hypothetical protein [Oscillatoria sp. FACHB-1407]
MVNGQSLIVIDWAPHSPLPIPHSPFPTPHSLFPIPHSPPN